MCILRLPIELRERCTGLARAALPNEACALVAGHVETDRDGEPVAYVATGIHPVANELASPSAFALDGRGMLDAETRIDELGQQVIGVLHSHPTSQAFPSTHDLADAERYDPHSAFVQLIVSMQGFSPTLRAFRYGGRDGSTVELVLEVPDGA